MVKKCYSIRVHSYAVNTRCVSRKMIWLLKDGSYGEKKDRKIFATIKSAEKAITRSYEVIVTEKIDG